MLSAFHEQKKDPGRVVSWIHASLEKECCTSDNQEIELKKKKKKASPSFSPPASPPSPPRLMPVMQIHVQNIDDSSEVLLLASGLF